MTLDDYRLFSTDSRLRSIAADLYDATRELPIISPHGHLDARLLLDDRPFDDPAALFVRDDHYVTRLLTATGHDVRALIAEGGERLWRAVADNWHLYAGTASGYWLAHELETLFGVDLELDGVQAYDKIAARLRQPEFRPRSLHDSFGIEFLATTDDPLDNLDAHAALAADPGFSGRVAPTFRPDAYIDPAQPRFLESVTALAEWHGTAVDDYDNYLRALEARREHFVARGAVSSDHGVLYPYTAQLDAAEAAQLFRQVVAGTATLEQQREFAGHMLVEMARMSVADGLVMTLHPGILRNHSTEALATLGPDRGHDIPVATEFTANLRPLLQRFGMHPGFHLVLFSVDEAAYGREIAPLAAFYPSVFIGAPWWFLDAPDAMLRFRSAVTEIAGFYKGSGFIDDTRAFLSIPARHDMARRADAAYLARLVGEGRVSLASANRIAVDLVVDIPRKAFKL